MKKIYVCSSLGEDMQESRKVAERAAVYVLKKGELPIWPMCLLTHLDDDCSDKRAFIRSAGKALLWMCDEIWVFGEVNREMEEEIHFGKQLNLPIKKIPQNELKRLLNEKGGRKNV
jgi:hypothetical protein